MKFKYKLFSLAIFYNLMSGERILKKKVKINTIRNKKNS